MSPLNVTSRSSYGGIARARPDRRQGPRRAEEVRVHYATQALLAAACTWADVANSGLSAHSLAADRLHDAVHEYRAAVEAMP